MRDGIEYNPIMEKRRIDYLGASIDKSTYTKKSRHSYKRALHKEYKNSFVRDLSRKLDLLYLYYTGRHK